MLGIKWGFVCVNDGLCYLVVNGDEGESGMFKDCYYLECSLYIFFEGMLIVVWVVEVECVFIYMCDEYFVVLEILCCEIKVFEDVGIVESGYIDLC